MLVGTIYIYIYLIQDQVSSPIQCLKFSTRHMNWIVESNDLQNFRFETIPLPWGFHGWRIYHYHAKHFQMIIQHSSAACHLWKYLSPNMTSLNRRIICSCPGILVSSGAPSPFSRALAVPMPCPGSLITPLHPAAEENYAEICQLLLSARAAVDTRNRRHGAAPLYMAACLVEMWGMWGGWGEDIELGMGMKMSKWSSFWFQVGSVF